MTKSTNIQIDDILNNIYNLIVNPERIMMNFLQNYVELFKL